MKKKKVLKATSGHQIPQCQLPTQQHVYFISLSCPTNCEASLSMTIMLNGDVTGHLTNADAEMN